MVTMKFLAVPTYSGVFDLDNKTCLMVLDGTFVPMVCNMFEPILIINLTGKILPNSVTNDYNISSFDTKHTDEERMTEMIKALFITHNVIIYTEDEEKIRFLILNDLYDFRMKAVSLTTTSEEEDIHVWMEYIKRLKHG